MLQTLNIGDERIHVLVCGGPGGAEPDGGVVRVHLGPHLEGVLVLQALFVDGARLACGLAASDITLPDLARLCDVFYLGGPVASMAPVSWTLICPVSAHSTP